MSEFEELLRNPAHWGFEAVTDIVYGSIVFILGSVTPERLNPFKRWITRHDREHHPEHVPAHFSGQRSNNPPKAALHFKQEPARRFDVV